MDIGAGCANKKAASLWVLSRKIYFRNIIFSEEFLKDDR